MNNPPTKKTRWQRYVDHKEASASLEQRSSLFLGLDLVSGTRIDVPRSALNRGHCHVQGGTGSGKTTSTLLSVALQAIRGYREADGQWSKKSPVVILDLKGDYSFFHSVRFAAEQDARQFRFFSTRMGHGYHFFDPFQVAKFRSLSTSQLATTIIRALSLDYGMVYGAHYFGSQNLGILRESIKDVRSGGGELTVGRVADSLNRLSQGKAHKDASHIVSTFQQLAEYPQINLSRHEKLPAENIDMYRALEEGEVVYIYMQMANEAPALRPIAGLMMTALVHAAYQLKDSRLKVPFTFVLADEFHHIAGNSFGDILSTSRDWGLHFFLANQDPTQLDTHLKGLREVVSANRSVWQDFNVDDPKHRDQLMRQSGVKPNFTFSSSMNSYGTTTESHSERPGWHFSDDDINEVNDTHLASFLYFNTGVPFEPGMRIRKVLGLHPIFRAQHEEYSLTPLPAEPQHELHNDPGEDPVSSERPRKSASKHRARPSDPANPELQKRMAGMWETLESEMQAH